MTSTAWRRGRLGAIEAPPSGEQIVPLVQHAGAIIEEIVSSADLSPNEYDQDHDEWVLVTSGSATVSIASMDVALETGDWLLIPTHVRHTVAAVSEGTRWLAVHLPPAD